MSDPTFCSLETLAEAVPDGALVAIAKDSSGVAMAATRELVRRGVRDLHLLCVPISGMQADILIGAGCVRTLETSAITLGEFGIAPRFVAALKAGTMRMIDSTCPAVYAGLQAAQKGIPFIPLRGLLGTDLLANRDDWKVIDNPFEPGDPIVVLKAIQPDVAVFHAALADRDGNVFVGRERELMIMAHAARRTLVTVEEITERADVAKGTFFNYFASKEALLDDLSVWHVERLRVALDVSQGAPPSPLALPRISRRPLTTGAAEGPAT